VGGGEMKLTLMHPPVAADYYARIYSVSFDERQVAAKMFGEIKPEEILVVSGKTATIQVKGILSADGPSPIDLFFGYSGTSYRAIIAACNDVAAMDDIEEVVFCANTPGGGAEMVDETYMAIKALGETRRTRFENHGMIASAGMWIASAAHEIVAMSPIAETGSIGVKVVGFDNSKLLEEIGFKRVVILSENAPNKAPSISDDEGIAEIKRELDAVERVFLSRVAEGRGVGVDVVKKDFGRGSVLIAHDPDDKMPDAISVGMIDGLANMQMGSNGRDAVVSSRKMGVGAQAKKENVKMSLEKFLAENPGAKAEHDAALSAAQETGRQSGAKAVEARIAVAKPFLSTDEYPAAINALAVKVVAGEVNDVALTAAVAAVDAATEQAKSAQAKSEDPGDVSAEVHNGDINGEDDYQAVVAKAKAARGNDL